MKLKYLLSLLVIILVQTGCTSSTTCSADTCGEGTVCNEATGLCEVTEDTTEQDVTSCETDSDCSDATLRCDNNICVPKCENVTCNEAAGEICDPTSGLCVGGEGACNIDEDCGDEQVCEANLCVGGRYADCDESTPCSSNLNCSYGVGFSLCVEPCGSTDECFGAEFCVPPGMAGLQDFAGHCFVNTCAPGGGANNSMQDTEYLAPCDVTDIGDGAGTCYGPFFNGFEYFGYCVAQRGKATLGEACTQEARQVDATACAEGICALGSNVCSSTCAVGDGIACSESGDSACYPAAAANGVCYPTVENPPGLGEPCSTGGDVMPCQDDLLCGYPNGDPSEAMACVKICDSMAPVGGAASCDEGQTCYVFDSANNPRGGVCINL